MSALLQLRIERLASGGEGVGREEGGRVVFVPATAPGDLARVRLVEEQKRFARAELVELLEAGPERVEPRCPLVGECGGCAWQHVSYAQQCRSKAERVADAFARVARLELPAPVECTPCPEPFGYRSRARVGFRDGVVGFRRIRSHSLCAAATCPVLVPALDQALGRLATKPPGGDGELTLAAGDDGAVCITGDGRKGPAIEILAGETPIRVSPGVFFQANALLRSSLAGAVHELAGEGIRALELFAGSGYFTVGLAERFEQVLVVESHGRATRDLASNLGAAGRDNVEVVTGMAERKLDSRRLCDFAPELVLLDPPRKGLDRVASDRIADLGAARIVYVSCDPATHARDCGRLAKRGYRLTSLRAFDLFPQTPHVEAIAVLEAPGTGSLRAR